MISFNDTKKLCDVRIYGCELSLCVTFWATMAKSNVHALNNNLTSHLSLQGQWSNSGSCPCNWITASHKIPGLVCSANVHSYWVMTSWKSLQDSHNPTPDYEVFLTMTVIFWILMCMQGVCLCECVNECKNVWEFLSECACKNVLVRYKDRAYVTF